MERREVHAQVYEILDRLGSHSGRRERRAVRQLRRLGQRTFPALVEALSRHHNANARSVVASTLSCLGPRSRLALYRALNDPSMTVHLHALVGVDRNWTPRTAPRVIRLLKDPSGGVRVNAVAVLGRHRVKGAVRPLTRALRDEKSYVRHAAREALTEIEGTSSNANNTRRR